MKEKPFLKNGIHAKHFVSMFRPSQEKLSNEIINIRGTSIEIPIEVAVASIRARVYYQS